MEFLLGCLVFFLNSFLSNEDLRDKELQSRNGLSNVVQKIHSRDTIRIAYLGGSITEAPGWREYSFDWFKQEFPASYFVQIPAAIGGTGSDFGAYRVGEQVIEKNPDLVFVEFAVNDNGKSEDKIIQAMEGIVRQIKSVNPKTDVCLIYTLVEDFVGLEKKGELPSSKIAMEKVADHYGIPSINFGFEVSKRVEEGTLIFTGNQPFQDDTMVFSNDRVHPFLETGQRIYAEVFQRAMTKLLNLPIQTTFTIPEALHTSPLVFTRTYPVSPDFIKGNWQEFDPKEKKNFEKFGDYFQEVLVASDTTSVLKIKFKGTAIGFADILGPDSGSLIIALDGKEYRKVTRFDEYCNFRRISYLLIQDLEDKEHEIVIHWNPQKIDKEGILARRKIVMENPKDYLDQHWYLGKLLVNGIINKNHD
ncbi:SGNH/GDSL hydrolase family protein [Algoriphagus sp. AK58]|uniref:SGNH/GDSL hydrolase family protein n=1 Tax=Algoriphagus sp. AK58 TaxID=1406877 RepID=UPI00164EF2C5|nr:SGNH/GDSL hydrolase family protein [Algoriphagus sp. AK58]MBC6366178.1 SGNH/GDSL hydrolase family protein [Algoriphagus sp. AK58]